MLVLAVLATSCGSSSSTGSTGSGGGTNPQSGAGGGGDYCQVIKDQLSGLDKVFPKDFSSADQLKAYGTYLEDTNNKALAAAPAEIKSDLETQIRVSNLAAASYKSGTRPPASVTAQLRTSEYQAAIKKVGAYAKDKCGISPSVAPTG